MKNNIKYSILDLAPVVSGDNYTQTFEKSAQFVQLAEKLGFKRYWLSEHHNMPNVASAATAILIGYLAGKSNTIRVGSGGIMLPNHSNLAIAEAFGTLGTLYPNRIDLGLGRAPGTDGRTAQILRRGMNLPFYDFEANIEDLQNYLSFDNQHSNVRAIPGEGVNIPIYILGSSTDSAHLAAKLGLPYAFAGHFAPTQFAAALMIYQTEFKPSEILQSPYTMLCINIIAADSDDEAKRLGKSFQYAILNILTDNRQPLVAPEEVPEYRLSEELRNTLLRWTALTFTGTVDTIKPEVEKLINEHHVNEVIVQSNIFDFDSKVYSYQLISELFKQINL